MSGGIIDILIAQNAHQNALNCAIQMMTMQGIASSVFKREKKENQDAYAWTP